MTTQIYENKIGLEIWGPPQKIWWPKNIKFGPNFGLHITMRWTFNNCNRQSQPSTVWLNLPHLDHITAARKFKTPNNDYSGISLEEEREPKLAWVAWLNTETVPSSLLTRLDVK